MAWARAIGLIATVSVSTGMGVGPAGAQETPVVIDGGPYGAPDPPPSPLVVDAGGPYVGVVGEPIELHGTVSGAEGDIRVIWSEDAEGIPCTFADETTLDATVTCHEPFQVGIVLTVEDLATGSLHSDVAVIRAEVPPAGPSPTTSTTSPSTTSTSAASATTTTTTTSGRPGQLPKTGAELGQLTVVGLLLIGSGAGLVALARRRDRRGK